MLRQTPLGGCTGYEGGGYTVSGEAVPLHSNSLGWGATPGGIGVPRRTDTRVRWHPGQNARQPGLEQLAQGCLSPGLGLGCMGRF